MVNVSCVAALGECKGVTTWCAIGGTSIRDDEMHIRGGANVLCGTPGRIMDLIRRNTLNPSTIAIVVLDEVSCCGELFCIVQLHCHV